jgi:hypothetical protein
MAAVPLASRELRWGMVPAWLRGAPLLPAARAWLTLVAETTPDL